MRKQKIEPVFEVECYEFSSMLDNYTTLNFMTDEEDGNLLIVVDEDTEDGQQIALKLERSDVKDLICCLLNELN